MKLKDKAYVTVTPPSQFFLAEREYIHAVDNHLPRIGTVERSDDLQQGCLACSRLTHDGHDLALLYLEPDAFEHFQCAERFTYVLDLYHNRTAKVVKKNDIHNYFYELFS